MSFKRLGGGCYLILKRTFIYSRFIIRSKIIKAFLCVCLDNFGHILKELIKLILKWYKYQFNLLTWQLSRWRSSTPFTRRLIHRRSLLKRLPVLRVLYRSTLTESLLEGNSAVGAWTTGRSFERIVSKIWFKEFEEGADWGWFQYYFRAFHVEIKILEERVESLI